MTRSSVLLFLLFPMLLWTQERYLDSLPIGLQKVDSTDVIKLVKISDYYLSRDINKSLYYIEKAKKNKVNDQKQGYIDFAYANYYYELGDFALSTKKATSAFNRLKYLDEKSILRRVQSLLLNSDKDRSNIELFEKKIKNYNRLLSEVESNYPSLELANYNLQAANISMYLQGDDFVKSVAYLQAAEDNFTQLNSQTGQAMAYIKYARYYKILFLKENKEKYFKQSLSYIYKAKEVFERLHQVNNKAYANYTLATLYCIIGNHEAAIEPYQQSLKAYKFLKNFLRAMKINEHLFISYSILEKRDLAIKVNKRGVALQDSIHFLEKKKLITDAEVRFNVEKLKAENEIKELKNKKDQIFYVGILIIFCLLFLIMLFSYNKLKSKKKAELVAVELKETQKRLAIEKDLRASELKALKSQMNPHFIFNALNSIQDYIIINEKKLAREYLVKFSRLIRIYLEQTQQSEVTLIDEVKALDLYLQLEKARFDDNFNYQISVDKNIDKGIVSVPSLFIQPYVENALKHGLMHKKEGKLLNINFDKFDEDTMFCAIIDNGIGREASVKINKKRKYMHKSFATSANEKRVTLINKTKSESKISVEIIDLYDAKKQALGTKVVLKIPI